MSIEPTFTHWTAVYMPAEESEPTATTTDFREMGEGGMINAEAAKAHFAATLGQEDAVLEVYPFRDADEALETWRATGAHPALCFG
ncbi:MAG: hypothetical protein ACU0B9_14895 [Limimaricola soesokkakensis]|uniref:hypothetical protein n=1 Tax=Limimaricola soesokkakensis TaxID=1343159 RepID=UPI00405A2DDA